MFLFKSLRTKTIISALIPIVLVLAGLTLIVLYSYERVAQEGVKQRDAELARISANRLSEGLHHACRILQDMAVAKDIQSMEPTRMQAALDKARLQLLYPAGLFGLYFGIGLSFFIWQIIAGKQRLL